MDRYWESFIVTCGEVLGQQYSYMWISGGRAVWLLVEKYWDSSTVLCGEVVGQHYSYIWRSGGTAVW